MPEQEARERVESLAPNYDVPPEVSPFAPLPMLLRCLDCRDPLQPWELFNVSLGGEVARGVCQTCADRRVDAHHNPASSPVVGGPREADDE